MSKDNYPFKDKDFVAAEINGTFTLGRVIIVDNICYLLQNTKLGTSPEGTTKGQKYLRKNPGVFDRFIYSWGFTVTSTGETTQGVTILKTADTYEGILEVANSFDKTVEISGDYVRLISKANVQTLFKQLPHADCCGSLQLHCFISTGEEDSYNIYGELEEKHIRRIMKFFYDKDRSVTCYLAQYQTAAISFVEELGFTKIHSFENVKSGNEVNIYHFDITDIRSAYEQMVEIS